MDVAVVDLKVQSIFLQRSVVLWRRELPIDVRQI